MGGREGGREGGMAVWKYLPHPLAPTWGGLCGGRWVCARIWWVLRDGHWGGDELGWGGECGGGVRGALGVVN